MKPNLMQVLERMNKVYTKNENYTKNYTNKFILRINESADWVHYFYQP